MSVVSRARKRRAGYRRARKKALSLAAGLAKKIASATRVIKRHTVKGKVREPKHSTRRSPNQSSRGGVKPRVIVLHSTEGGYQGSIAWLCNPAAQASAHIVIGKDGSTTRLVEDAAKAWHVANDNPFTLGIEQEGKASQSSWPAAQLRETAKWIAWWSKKYGIPITHSTSKGVCRHSDLGAAGGGHHDPGKAYPLAKVLSMARNYREHGW